MGTYPKSGFQLYCEKASKAKINTLMLYDRSNVMVLSERRNEADYISKFEFSKVSAQAMIKWLEKIK